jgi:hypothetical protein
MAIAGRRRPANDACQLRRPPKFQDDQGIVTEVWLE